MKNNLETKQTALTTTLQKDPLYILGLDNILKGGMREVNELLGRSGQPPRYLTALEIDE